MARDARTARRSTLWEPVAGRGGRACSSSGRCAAPAARTYLAVRGGLDVPAYLGSRAHVHARALRRARRPRAARRATCCTSASSRRPARRAGDVDARCIPRLTRRPGRSACSYGPHGAPDFFTADDIDDVLRHRLEGPLQLRPHRRAADRPEAALGAPRRRRGRPAPVEHPRQRLRDRHRSTSPATCRSSSAPTARASAASSARRRSSTAERGSSASSRPATRVRFVPVSLDEARRPLRPGARDRRCAPSPRTRCAAPATVRRSSSAATRPRPPAVADPADGDANLLVEYGPTCSTSTCGSASTR